MQQALRSHVTAWTRYTDHVEKVIAVVLSKISDKLDLKQVYTGYLRNQVNVYSCILRKFPYRFNGVEWCYDIVDCIRLHMYICMPQNVTGTRQQDLEVPVFAHIYAC